MDNYYSHHESVKTMFYQQDFKFNYFRDVTEEKIRQIDDLVKEYRRKYIPPKTSYMSLCNSTYNNVQEYVSLLEYLLKKNDLSWDDKMLFIIRFYDPELKLLRLYLEAERIDKNFESKCRSLIKIYDSNIIKYEKIFFRVVCNNDLIFGIKRNYLKSFFTSYVTSSTSLVATDDEIGRIIAEAREYKNIYGIPSINDLAFQLTQQVKKIDIKSAKYAMIFMIFVIDEQFKASRVYDEYCNWDEIKSMSIEELGFFDKDFTLNEVKFGQSNRTSHYLNLFREN